MLCKKASASENQEGFSSALKGSKFNIGQWVSAKREGVEENSYFYLEGWKEGTNHGHWHYPLP